MTDATAAAAPPHQPPCWQRTAMIGLVMWVLIMIAGPITGPQAIFGSLAARGVFRDKCSAALAAPASLAPPSTSPSPTAPTLTPPATPTPTATMHHWNNTTPSVAPAAFPRVQQQVPEVGVVVAAGHVAVTTTTETPGGGCAGCPVTPGDPLTCTAQEESIESAADLCLSICNFLCVLWGFAQDTIGARKVALIGVTLWTIAKSCAGFLPASGIMWTVCESVAASASLGAYSALGLEHLKQACASERLYNVMGFISSAVWDIAVLMNLALAQLYGWRDITLWEAYMIYGLGAGLPAILGLLVWPAKDPVEKQPKVQDQQQQRPAPDENRDDARQGGALSRHAADVSRQSALSCPSMDTIHSPIVSTSPVASNARTPGVSSKEVRSGEPTPDVARLDSPLMKEPPAGSDKSDKKGLIATNDGDESSSASDAPVNPVKAALGDMKIIFSSPIFWIFAAHASAMVTVGYFMIANAGSLARGHHYGDAQQAREVTTYIMSAMSITSLAPGRLLFSLGTKRGLTILLGTEAFLVAAVGVLIGVGDETVYYVAFGIMFIWRVWGFGLAFPFISWRFKACPRGVGVCYGGVFALAGAVSIAAGAAASSALHANPVDNIRPVMWSLCGVTFVIQAVFAVCVARVDERSLEAAVVPGDVEDAPEVRTASA